MPTSTNLSLVTPASTDYVTNGATAMTTLANGIDAYYAAPTSYTPTTTNITAGTVAGRYTRLGKLGLFSIGISAGTATAAGVITLTLPSGWTTAAVLQVVPAVNSAAVISATAAASGTTVTVRADAAGTNWTLGASLTGVRLNGWLYLA
jgi:hypothetical protein